MEIIIMSNHFNAELQKWCDEQNIQKYYFGGENESFAAALKDVIIKNPKSDIFLMSSEIRYLPCAMERMQQVLCEEKNIGAIIPKIVKSDIIAGRRYFKDLSEYAKKQRNNRKK